MGLTPRQKGTISWSWWVCLWKSLQWLGWCGWRKIRFFFKLDCEKCIARCNARANSQFLRHNLDRKYCDENNCNGCCKELFFLYDADDMWISLYYFRRNRIRLENLKSKRIRINWKKMHRWLFKMVGRCFISYFG
jgi:hypothetical protein